MIDAARRHAAWDGLRGIAVVAVLLYHVEGHPLPGGFLGVSLFFTLSGFVIMRTLLVELERGDRVSLTGFWARRVRRLLPPIAVCLVLVLLYGHLHATGNQRGALRWDMVATLTDWMNWRVLATGVTYGGQDLNPSPLLHAWSLSIEEQAYVLLPLLAVAGWRVKGRAGLVAALAAPLVVSFSLGLALASDPQQWYLATHVRVGEILVGALLATMVGTAAWDRFVRVARVAAWPAVGFLVWAAWNASTTSTWLPRGGLLVNALATATLIGAGTVGAWRRVLGWRPLAALGRISYGVYLYHWPLYLWITPRAVGWGRWPTTALRIAVTISLATASYLLLERHVIAFRLRQRRTLAIGATGIAVALGVVAIAAPSASANERITITDGLVSPSNAPAPTVGRSSPAATPAAVTTSAAPTTAPPATEPPAPSPTSTVDEPASSTPDSANVVDTTAPSTLAPPVLAVQGDGGSIGSDEMSFTAAGSPWFTGRTDGVQYLNGPPLQPSTDDHVPVILVIGDSAAGTLGFGLQRVSADTGTAVVYVAAKAGCPISEAPKLRWNDDVEFTPDASCDVWQDNGPSYAEQVHPDLVVSLASLWEVVDRKEDPDGPWVAIGDPSVDAKLMADLAAYTDAYGVNGARVMWMLPPPLKNSIYAQVPGPLPEEDPARLAHLDQIVAVIAATRPNTYTYDLATALQDRYGDPYALCNRVDGFHWSNAGADREAEWLLPALVAIATGA